MNDDPGGSQPSDDGMDWPDFFARLDESKRRAEQARIDLNAACIVASRGIGALTRVGWIGEPGSARKHDTRAGALGIGDESVADLVTSEASVQLRVIVDLMRGYGSLILAESSHVGAVSLARGLYEACLWVQAILDPRIDAEERVLRAMNRRLARLWTTQGTFLGPSAHDQADARRAIGSILKWAADRDIPLSEGKRRRAPFIGSLLSATKVAEDVDLPPGLGLHAWQHPSAISHGEHGSDIEGWLATSADLEVTPAWMSAIWTSGVSLGLFLVARAFSAHLGRPTLVGEWQILHERWWTMCGPSENERAPAPNWLG